MTDRQQDMMQAGANRSKLLIRGIWLTGATVVWNILEGIIALKAGLLASSVALIGFGIDSFVETTSALIVGWRLIDELHHHSEERAERVERMASKTAGTILLMLAVYIVIDAGRRLLGLGAQAEESFLGIIITGISLVVMPFLAWGKLRVAGGLDSSALRADAYETIACTWLSLTTLIGLTLNATLGWWWADPLAALMIVPLVVKEGLEGLRGEGCMDCH